MTVAVRQIAESPVPHRFTREEYYLLGESGVFDGQRVELIEGEIVDMAPQQSSHAVATTLAQMELQKIFPGCVVRGQLPMSFETDSEPEPDIAVVPGNPRDYRDGHPQTALLVVEIADSSLRYDRTRKAALYAKAGIQDYWVVNLVNNRLEVFRQPVGGEYESVVTLKPGDRVSPLAKPEAAIVVADLLP